MTQGKLLGCECRLKMPGKSVSSYFPGGTQKRSLRLSGKVPAEQNRSSWPRSQDPQPAVFDRMNARPSGPTTQGLQSFTLRVFPGSVIKRWCEKVPSVRLTAILPKALVLSSAVLSSATDRWDRTGADQQKQKGNRQKEGGKAQAETSCSFRPVRSARGRKATVQK